MSSWFPDLPKGGWRRIAFMSSATTLIVCVLAVIGMVIGNGLASEQTSAQDYYTTITLASLLTAPIFSYLMVKQVQLHHANEQLHVLATTDFLTGALNRRAFMAHVESRLAADAESAEISSSALFVVDVDYFKTINDRYGHQTGDLALVRIADTLRTGLRYTDLFGRLGGEEFGIYLDDVTPAEAMRIAERCRLAVNACSFTPEGEEHMLSISIGIAITTPGEDFTSLYQQADNRLYLAKEHGRNRIEMAVIRTEGAAC